MNQPDCLASVSQCGTPVAEGTIAAATAKARSPRSALSSWTMRGGGLHSADCLI